METSTRENISSFVLNTDAQCQCSTVYTEYGYFIANSFLSIVSFFTVMVNLLFILTVVLNRKLFENSTSKFLLSNAVCDWFVGWLVMPFHILKTLQSECWSYGPLLCKAMQSIDIHLTTMSIFHLTGVAGERYFKIAYPFVYDRWSLTATRLLIVLCWILPAPTTFVPIFLGLHQEGEFTRSVGNSTTSQYNKCGKGNSEKRPCRCSYWASADFTAGTTFFQFFLPISLMAFFYIRIFMIGLSKAREMEKLKQSVASNANLTQAVARESMDSTVTNARTTPVPTRRASHMLFFSKEIRIVRLCAVVLVAFLLCQTPYFVMMILESLCVGVFFRSDEDLLHPDISTIRRDRDTKAAFYAVLWLGLANSLINPILLFWLGKNYRTGLKVVIYRRLPRLAKWMHLQNPLRPNYARSASQVPDSVDDGIVMRRTLSTQLSTGSNLTARDPHRISESSM